MQITLHVELRLLAVGGRGQGDDLEDAWTQALGDRANGAALTGGIASLEDDDGALSGALDPRLQGAELDLKLAELARVVLAAQLLA